LKYLLAAHEIETPLLNVEVTIKADIRIGPGYGGKRRETGLCISFTRGGLRAQK